MKCEGAAVRGRLGSHGKVVHALDGVEILGKTTHYYWGSSLCGTWAGAANLTSEPVTCYACQRKLGCK